MLWRRNLPTYTATGTITKMGKDESVTINVISRIVTALGTSDISVILEIED